ncbi:MAG: Gfo/Idh/MocA family protein [Granulosicoccus sp.]
MTIKTLANDTQNLQTDVALVGAGMIAQRHVSALSAACRLARLVTIVSRHPDRARHLSQYYEGPPPKFVSDLSCVVHDPAVQVVIVATPPSVRIELIRALSAAGKNILLEKPVARNVNEAEQVVQICERAGVKLGVLFQHRMRLSSQAAKRLLLDGTLGKPGHIEIAVPLWREQSYYDELERGTYARDGGGVLITQAIHTMDLALSLAGPVTRVQAMTATTPLHRMEAEDFAVAGLQFASGAVGSLVASTATYPHGCESITIHCSEGSIRLEAEVLKISWRDGRSEQYPPIKTCEEQRSNTPKHEWHQSVIEDFIIAVKRDCKPMVTGHEALAAHRLIEAIELSSSEGVAVDLPL